MNIFHWIVILVDIAAIYNVFILEPSKQHKTQSVKVYSYGKVVK